MLLTLKSAKKLLTKATKTLCINILHNIWLLKNFTYFSDIKQNK